MPKPLKVALWAAVALLLFLSAQGTAALWHSEQSLDLGTVSTGDLRLVAGDDVNAAQHYVFSSLSASNLVPGDFVQAPVTLINDGDADLEYNLSGISTLPPNPTTADIALADFSVLSIQPVEGPNACEPTTSLHSPLFHGALDQEANLGAARTLHVPGEGISAETLCVRLTLDVATPQSAAGGKLQLVLNFTGQQK